MVTNAREIASRPNIAPGMNRQDNQLKNLTIYQH